MLNKLLISVIITVFNVEKYLQVCLESVLGQTYRNLEVILIDDGSTDRSGKICDLYAEGDSRIRVLHKKNAGLVAARKSGVAMASGDVVTYVDGDDWVEEFFYEELVHHYQKNQADVILTGCIKETETRQIFIANNIKEGYYDKSDLEGKVYSKMLYFGDFYKFGIQQYLWNKLYKKELLFKWQLKVDDRISNGEDVACLYPLLLDANSIEITNVYGYHYRIHDKSMTAKLNEDYPVDVYRLYAYLKNIFSISKYENVMKRQVLVYYSYMSAMASKYLLGIRMIPEFQYQYIFPFEKVFSYSTVLLIAQGRMGKEYYTQLQRTNMCKFIECIWVEGAEKVVADIDLIKNKIQELSPDCVVVGGEDILKRTDLLIQIQKISSNFGCQFIENKIEE